jgi:hypothetical protein
VAKTARLALKASKVRGKIVAARTPKRYICTCRPYLPQDTCGLHGGVETLSLRRRFSFLTYLTDDCNNSNRCQSRLWAIHNHAMAAPVSVPHLLLRRQLLRAGRLLAVLDFEQKVPASVTNQQIGTALTDSVQQLHRRASAAKCRDDLPLVGIDL